MKVCPRCGRSEREVPFIGFFCRECYLQLKPPIKERRITVKVCPTCGRIFLGRWAEYDLSKIAAWVQSKIKVSEEIENPILTVTLGEDTEKSIRYRGMLFGTVEGVPIEYRFSGSVEKRYEQCPYCARKHGGYYEAVLQLRGKRWEEAYQKVISMLSREKDPKAFVSKEVTQKKGGIDLYLGSKKVAERLAKRLKKDGAIVRFSHEHVTERDGRPVTREFISVRYD